MRRSVWSTALRSRQGSQALVEFGIVAILFVMILFAIVDFGLLLNGWMTVNAGAREAARTGAAGGTVLGSVFPTALRGLPPPDPRSNDSYLWVTADYCQPSPAAPRSCVDYAMDAPAPPATVPAAYTCNGVADRCVVGSLVQTADPDAPEVQPGFSLTVIVVANTYEVVTPLVRPFFGCAGARPGCPVTLVGSATMRYEGPSPP